MGIINSINHVITDRTAIDYQQPDFTGYPAHLAAQDTSANLAAMGAKDFPNSLWIEPKNWKQYWADNKYDELNLSAMDMRNRFTNQNPTDECTCHCLVQCAETSWNATRGGKGSPVLFSQIGIYSIANPGQWGGAGCQQVLRIAMQYGFIPERVHGQETRFKHTLWGTCGKGNVDNSTGKWVTESMNPEYFAQAAPTRRHFKPTEVINPRSREEIVCLLIHRRGVGVGRNGHSIPYLQPVWESGQASEKPTIAYSDSYDVIRYDSWSTVSSAVEGSYCIWSLTVPDDWDKPAGTDML
jgi:hypothetical protein